MNARFVSICVSLTGLMVAAGTDALGGGMGGGYGAPAGGPRGIETYPAGRQETHQSAATKTPTELLQQNTKLADSVAKLLPAGTDLKLAADGFKNLGEFVAAAHVSNNLGIPFADLKAKILGGESLGGAIQALRPEADGLVEARKARARAEDDLARS